jgi:hypothetical protein
MAEAQKEGENRNYVNKRRRKDWVSQAISIFTGGGWGLAVATALVFSKAQPETENFFTRVFGQQIFGYWNERYLWFAFFGLVMSFIFCLFGIIFTMMRHRRKTDRFNKPLIFMSAITMIGILVFIWRFFPIM